MKYCVNGEYAIATGDGTSFTRYFYQESIPFFEVNSTDYWLVDKSLIPKPEKPDNAEKKEDEGDKSTGGVGDNGGGPEPSDGSETAAIKKFQSITISGKLSDKLVFNQLMSYFIIPFKDNPIDIEVSFKIKSNPSLQLDETKQQYKSAKEASKQLGFEFTNDSDLLQNQLF